jgi:hypothetical protein
MIKLKTHSLTKTMLRAHTITCLVDARQLQRGKVEQRRVVDAEHCEMPKVPENGGQMGRESIESDVSARHEAKKSSNEFS